MFSLFLASWSDPDIPSVMSELFNGGVRFTAFSLGGFDTENRVLIWLNFLLILQRILCGTLCVSLSRLCRSQNSNSFALCSGSKIPRVKKC